LIRYSNKNKCEIDVEAIVQFCLKADGDLVVVKMNKYFIENTMAVFLETEEI
jgi:hypothetical protein